jgi:hypothetical protein
LTNLTNLREVDKEELFMSQPQSRHGLLSPITLLPVLESLEGRFDAAIVGNVLA